MYFVIILNFGVLRMSEWSITSLQQGADIWISVNFATEGAESEEKRQKLKRDFFIIEDTIEMFNLF
jgi:hypothetical protein